MRTLGQSGGDATDLATISHEAPCATQALPFCEPSTPRFEAGRVDRCKSESFRALPSVPGLLVRTLSVTETYSASKAIGRMLKMDPSCRFKGPSPLMQSRGIKIIYILNGWACFDIDGLGETRLEAGTLACLPPNNCHRLVDGALSFEDIEYELPFLTSSLKKTWSVEGASCATPSMIDAETPKSFRHIPNFVGAVERRFPIVEEITGGAANASVLRNNPPHIWDGTPWHIHHNNFFCSVFAKGSGTMEYEGFGEVTLNRGDVFIQQGEVRHREVLFSPDFETFKIELPGSNPTTVLVYDKDTGGYKSMLFASAQDSAEAMA